MNEVAQKVDPQKKPSGNDNKIIHIDDFNIESSCKRMTELFEKCEKRQKIVKILREQGDLAKVSIKKLFPDKYKLRVPKKYDPYYDILNYCAQSPLASMMREVEEQIILKLGISKMNTIYPTIVAPIMSKIRNDFYTVALYNQNVNSKISSLSPRETMNYDFSCYKYHGRTCEYRNFLKVRNFLNKRLVITRPLIRHILKQAASLPEYVVRFDGFRKYIGVEMQEIQKSVSKVCIKTMKYLDTKWLMVIVDFMRSQRRNFKDEISFKEHVKVAQVFIELFISMMVRRTMVNAVDVLTNVETTPQIQITVWYDFELKLSPTISEIKSLYVDLVETIFAVGTLLRTINFYCIPSFPPNFVKLHIQKEFTEEQKDRLRTTIDKMYQQVEIFLRAFESIYAPIYDEETQAHQVNDTSLSFEETCGLIRYYEEYQERLNVENRLVRLNICVLDISQAIAHLESNVERVVIALTSKLSALHYRENIILCENIFDLRTKVLTLPTTTAGLVELMAYSTWASSEYLTRLIVEVTESLVKCFQIIERSGMTDSRLEAMAGTILWIYELRQVFDSSALTLEKIKFELEENLLHKIEGLKAGIEEMMPFLEIMNDMDDVKRAREYLVELRKMIKNIRQFDEIIEWINHEEALFKFPLSLYPAVEELKNIIYPFFNLVTMCDKWRRYSEVWLFGPFELLTIEKVEEIVDGYYKELQKTLKTYRMVIKTQIAEDYPRRFTGLVDDADVMNLAAPLKLCIIAMEYIRAFRPYMNVVSIFCNTALRQRHWDEMSEIAGFDMTPDAGTTLYKLVERGFGDNLEQFEIISTGATKELQLQVALAKMIEEWKDIHFKIGSYKDSGINILIQLDDIQAILEDHIMKTLTMRGSVFVKPIEKEVKAWYEKITRMNKTIDEWGKVQGQWLYLLPIFSSKDIVAQMPEEGTLFKEVDGVYRRYMNVVVKDTRVTESAGAPGMYEALVECTAMLERINEGVARYLEKKRLVFTRFFFLSNDEMLEILSETKDPLRVQPHLRKCFEGINKLHFDDQKVIHAMYSQEGEKIQLVSKIDTKEARGSVELWLVQVETQMVLSVKEEISKSFHDYAKNARTKWVQIWPGQVVLAVSQIYWTLSVHACLSLQKQTLHEFHQSLERQLQDIVKLIRSNISNLARITIKALIVIDVHAKDVIKELVEHKLSEENDFKWLVQLRYYWEEDDCLARMINATVMYAYEYLGNSDRLVITPLTDRCYRTLISAYHLHLNGAPEGPAGTGKTETTKDLAKAIAVQCVVFNCSDGLDYKAMGKFFKGLASSGAWACFDEFNRIELEVLSVVAQQILSIVLAVRANLTKFVFEDTELNLNPNVYICITMNPGYAGRSELPDNLKVLFRTVAMMVPDYAMIGEISLYSYGFKDARTLAVKIVTTYRLCSEQLSSQNHYDYGMRAVKTVLSACGNIKRKFPDENEDILLLRSLIDVNLPKFLSYDVPLFEGIISDLFPGIMLPQADYSDLIRCCKLACGKRNLQPRESFMLKIIQTYEMMIVRHGFMLVGDPFSGKTSTLKVLADALTLMFEDGLDQVPVHYQFINPKSVTMGQLYGQFDPISYEWTDGIVATCFRNFCMDTRPDRNWVVFDGPVDAVWIENMNTVLDDNKKLCLTSGEVMAMTNSMSMIFEVMDLTQASPATVSRCGMIYMESATLGWRPFAESWVTSVSELWKENKEDAILELFEWLLPACASFIRKNCKQLVYPGDINAVKSTLTITEMLMDDAVQAFGAEGPVDSMAWIQASVMIAIIWGMAGILDEDSRTLFDEFYKVLWKGADENHPMPEEPFKLEVQVPTEGLVMDYIFIYTTLKGSWKYWPDLVKQVRMNENVSITQLLVPTVETAKYMNMIEMHMSHKKPILLVGPTGTGKSFYMQDILMNKLNQEIYEANFVTFTARISASQTQDLVLSKLMKGKKGYFSAPKGKTSVIFIDDMNMPAKEQYGAQPPIELLRQFFDHGHWYNLRDTSKIYLFHVLFVAAMGLVGGSRQEVYPRFLRHFSIFSINDFTNEVMVKIFSNVLLTSFKRNGFPTEIMITVVPLVNATLKMYSTAKIGLLPTPAKSHYVFNLRDFARVIQGCGMLRKESVGENKKIFTKLWVHEILRVFYDRLVDDTDRHWVYQRLREIVVTELRENFDGVFDNLRNRDAVVTETALRDLLFGTYLDNDSMPDERRYEEIESIEVLFGIAEVALDEYNATHKNKVDIVLFRYALEHLSKLCRILSMSSGSALLVGIGGSGRQSLTKVAAAVSSINVFQPEISKNYGVKEFRDDIKLVLKESGGLGKHTVFLFTEDQLKDEAYLQDIDCLLNSGEVPNIYEIDEKQEILELVRLAAQGGNRNLDVSPLAVFSFFTKRCKEKLHIVLAFSPVGSALRTRLRLYPSLVNCCTIDWYEAWPEDSLEMVAHHWMKDLAVEEKVKLAVISTCKFFHVEARIVARNFYEQYNRMIYITSASYLDLIINFQKLMKRKQEETKLAKFRYVSGLDKLDFAAQQVSEMQKSLEELQPQLKLMKEKAMQMLIEIEKETKEAERASELVREDEKVANIQAAGAQALKRECEADLALALPILEEAIEALNTLKPADITLVKSMKNPPAAVKLVMAAVCVIKDVKPDRIPDPATGRMQLDYWGPSKKILGEMSFLQQLKDFDKDHIPAPIMARIRKEFIPHKDFKPGVVAKASGAAEGLCKWIIAMDLYDAVAKVVAPKKEKLAKAEAEFAETMAILEAKRELLAKLEARLANLNEQLVEAQNEQQRLQDAVDLCSDKLMRAKKLIGGLGGEKSRWMNAAEELQKIFDCLAGDILVSCGVIAYLAPLTIQFRNECIVNWRQHVIDMEIPSSQEYDFCKVLGSEIQIQEWYIHGLPRDSFSTQNSIIQNTSNRWSLLIDPQIQANKWIKIMEKKNNIGVVKFSDHNYMKVVEHCVEYGMPVLVENIMETLAAPLDPILQKKVFKQAGEMVIGLGDNVIPYHKNFRLYMTTKLRNPHYMPEVFNKVTIINFALTAVGLEDQLLGIVVANERPDLQQQKEQLVIDDAANRSALKEVEDKILKTLSETEGNILENETAISVLDTAKTLATEILEKQKITKKTEKVIEEFRLSYRPVAAHSTTLYYSISDLPNVDPMYQYSLVWFIGLYRSSILNSSKPNDLEQRLVCIKNDFTYNLYTNVCRSLFEKDKLLYSFWLTIKIMLFQNKIHEDEYRFFLTGGVEMKNPHPNPAADWLSEKSWDELCRLSDLSAFKGFYEDFGVNIATWKNLYETSNPETASFPGVWEKKLFPFERLMVLRFIRPDKLSVSVNRFVEKVLGADYVTPPSFDLAKSYNDSNNLCPLIFILSPGTDPMMALNKFAERKGFGQKFSSISLGQGQGPIAEAMIRDGMDNGAWVCLQNCHLAVSWLPRLEKLCELMDDSNTHDNFRLWLTSYPSDKFPVSILQNGVKMTNEPPTGLHQNLKLSYTSDPIKDPEFFNGIVGKEDPFSRLLYGLCFFHAVVQERRTFGPLGWNIPYGFNDSDLHISIQQLMIFIRDFEEIPYEALTYLTGECNYGGRVTDDWDRRLIITILDDFLNPNIVTNRDYLFSNVNTCYGLPVKKGYKDYLMHIERLPDQHPPEVFGLHKNAGITRDLQTTNITIRSLLLLMGEASSSSGNTDELVLMISGDLLSKLPPNFDLDVASAKYPVEYTESMNTVLVQELERFNKLVTQVRSTLSMLQKAIHGLVVMTPELELLYNSVLLGRLPESWAKVSYPSLKSLANYFADLLDRVHFLRKWHDEGKPPTFWLSGFFFTQAFLTGAKQNYARQFTIPIDRLDFDQEIINADWIDHPAQVGVYVNGLFVDGARFDRQQMCLEEQRPRVLSDVMPIIWLKPILIAEFKDKNRYKSPVYKTSERRGVLSTTGHSTNYVLPLYLDTKKPPSHWVKRSVALLCQSD